MTSRSVLKEPLVRSIVIHIGDHVVQNDDDEVEVPRQSLQLLTVSVDKLGSLNVIDCAILLDEVLADRVDIVDDYESDLLLLDPSSEVNEELVVLVNAIHMCKVDAITDVPLCCERGCSALLTFAYSLGQKVV